MTHERAYYFRRKTKVRFLKELFISSILGVLFTGASAYAAPTKRLDLGLTYISYQMSRVSTASDGSKSTMGTTFYDLKFLYQWPIAEKLSFSPTLLYMPDQLYSQESPDKATKTSLTLLSFPVVYHIDDFWTANAGFGILHYTLRGTGGSQVLNNGSGQTEFSLPSRTVTTRTVVFQYGADYKWNETKFGLDMLVQNLLSNTKRTYSLVLGVTHNILPYF